MAEEIFSEEQNRASTEIAKCPSCGANMVYDPETKSMKCPYCGTVSEIKGTRYGEKDLGLLFNQHVTSWDTDTKVFRCSNCGAVTVIGNKELSKSCAYCGTSNIVESKDISGMKPDAVLPFTITKETAKMRLIAWAKKKVFAPRKFKLSFAPEEINGNYVPSFTFDASAFGTYTGRLGKYYYETRVVDGKQQQVRKIRYFAISGTRSHFFNDVLIQASDRVDQKTVNTLSPFDTDNAQKYAPEYMHGFTATQYVRDGRSCWESAKKVMYEALKRRILSSYDYDVVDRFEMSVTYSDEKYKYLLLPLYIGHYDYKKKLYNFFVNGRNGNCAGKVPISPLRVGLLILGILTLIAGAVILYINYGGN